MKLLSINIALPHVVQMSGKPVLTAIDKQPAAGARAVGALGLEGDGQADLTVHGGVHQAVYSYPFEHYPFWEEVIGRGPLPYGTFGENLTTTGMLETEVCIGDRYRIGTAVLEVTSPRLPCFKFAHRVGRPQIIKEFLLSGRCGFYWRVLVPGVLSPGDPLVPVRQVAGGVTMRTLLGLMRMGEGDRPLIERALAIEDLAPLPRAALEQRLA